MQIVDEYEARRAARLASPAPVEVVEVEAPAPVEVVEVEAPAPVSADVVEVVEVEAPAPAGWRWFNVSAEAAPALLACGYPSARGAACLPVSSLLSIAARLRALAPAYPGALELAARIEGYLLARR